MTDPNSAAAAAATAVIVTAKIESIFSSPIASGTMVSRPVATLIEGVGMDGDRYALTKGTYSCLKASLYNNNNNDNGGKGSSKLPEPGRQLTLISGDGVRKVLQTMKDRNDNGNDNDNDGNSNVDLPTKSIGDFRRNVVLTGITSSELLSTVGCVLEFTSSDKSSSTSSSSSAAAPQPPRVLVHRNCVPCMYNERKNQLPGLMEALWESGGVSCEIIRGGTISVGDTLTVVALPPPSPSPSPDAPTDDGPSTDTIRTTTTTTTSQHQHLPYHSYRIDPGKQSSGFFVRPSKRTAAMVRGSLQHSKATYEQLVNVDPDGVQRAESSYASVGLSFWPKHKNR